MRALHSVEYIYDESVQSRAMATNTAPQSHQWLKNAGVLDHSTLYLLCYTL